MDTRIISIVVTLILPAAMALFPERALSAQPLPSFEDLIKDSSQAKILEEMRKPGPSAEQPLPLPRKSTPKRRNVAEVV